MENQVHQMYNKNMEWIAMLFALYDFLAYCLYSISRFSGESALLCAAFSEKPAVFVMKRIKFM